jgi:hypothetical protein
MNRISAALAAALALLGGPAAAALITFDDPMPTLTGSSPNAFYVEDGFRFEWYGPGPTFTDDGAGGKAAQIVGNAQIINAFPEAGGFFTLHSFTFSGGGASRLSAYVGSNEVVAIGLSGLAGTVTLGPLWQSITSIQWCGGCVTADNPNNSIDNLNITFAPRDAIPEPGTWTLMLLGFGALGALLRRRGAEPA